MENFLTVASEARVKYQNKLAAISELPDRVYDRSLTKVEMRLLHNAWMNDTQSWMRQSSLENYERLREEAVQGAKGKGQRGAAQPAKGHGKGQRGPGQAAQALKKKGFNTFCFEFIGSKAMLMCAVQHPSAFKTAQGLRGILNDIEEVHESAEYRHLRFNAEKKTTEESLLKEQRDNAVKELMRGRAANRTGMNPDLASRYRDGMGVGSMKVLHNMCIGEGGRIP